MPPQIPKERVEQYDQLPLAPLNVVLADTVDFGELVVEVLWIVGLCRQRLNSLCSRICWRL